jgi:hypothetical protein
MPSSAQTLLIRELEHARRLHEDRHASPARAAILDRVADWQGRRLNATYADLSRDPRYAQAILFFQSDLYGPADFSRRDADLARVVPLMVRLVPNGVIATIAMAMELSTLSQELDRALIEVLDASREFTVAQYCAAYRACGNRAERARQIELIGRTGRALDRYVRTPFVRGTLALMRKPARAAGLSALQDFLERGFASFAAMRGADEFLGTVVARETSLMEEIFSGNAAPFPDPLR